MSCYNPLNGWRSKSLTKNGKFKVVFNVKEGHVDMPIKVPCGQCIGCRIDKARQWAVRIMNEASLHDVNCFITLTYDNINIPYGGTLVKKHFQDFMKRLRKKVKVPIRFFHCGEYGEKMKRPHYHAVIFGYDFPDKEKATETYCISKELFELWQYGIHSVQELNFNTASYVARYVVKKVNGAKKDDHYININERNGEIYEIIPEYITMSRKPGLAKNWLDKYASEVYNTDSVVIEGREYKVPRYYDEKYGEINEEVIANVKRGRKYVSEGVKKNNYSERLRVREIVAEAKYKLGGRKYEQ